MYFIKYPRAAIGTLGYLDLKLIILEGALTGPRIEEIRRGERIASDSV
jgi:hypothetical protein